MEHILLSEDGLDYGITDEFDSKYLIPIISNLLFKAETVWDDYNEVYHCCKLIENVKANKAMLMDFHFIKKSEKYLGIALITKGIIDYGLFFNEPFLIDEDISKTLIFNYFHVSLAGRGNGEKWFRDVIINHYKSLNFKAIYLKSSHQKVFSMYKRLGIEVGEYLGYSDNKCFKRKGKIFKILL